MQKIDFDGFSVSLIQDEEGDWLAHFVELPNISAFANTPVKALSELKTAWEATKESYIRRKEPIPIAPAKKEYTGRFNVRVDSRVHRALAIEAARAHVSLNALVAQKLARVVDIAI